MHQTIGIICIIIAVSLIAKAAARSGTQGRHPSAERARPVAPAQPAPAPMVHRTTTATDPEASRHESRAPEAQVTRAGARRSRLAPRTHARAFGESDAEAALADVRAMRREWTAGRLDQVEFEHQAADRVSKLPGARALPQPLAAVRPAGTAGPGRGQALVVDAATLVICTQYGSTELLVQMLGIEPPVAAEVMEYLHGLEIVGPARGAARRYVLVPPDRLEATISRITES